MSQPGPDSRDVMDVIYRRRAVRSYKPQEIDADTIRVLLRAAVQAPTAVHSEPWAFAVIQDRSLLKRLSDQAKVQLLQSIPHDAKVSGYRALLENSEFNIFYDAGTLLVIYGPAAGPYVAADCWLAAENLMLAACALGLGTCPIGFAVPVLNAAAVKAELGIPSELAAVAPIILGVPSASSPPVSRKEPQIVCWKK